jgi:hypothetical protein
MNDYELKIRLVKYATLRKLANEGVGSNTPPATPTPEVNPGAVNTAEQAGESLWNKSKKFMGDVYNKVKDHKGAIFGAGAVAGFGGPKVLGSIIPRSPLGRFNRFASKHPIGTLAAGLGGGILLNKMMN